MEKDDLPVEHLTPFEYYFYLTNGWVGTVLNLIVLFIALRHADTHDKPRQIVVMNMSFADLMTCIVFMLTRPQLNRFPEFLCYPYYLCIFTCQICSCVNLLWLNVDKLIYIKCPLHYYQLVRRKRVLILTVFTWIFLGIIGMIAYYGMVIIHPCNQVSINQFIYLAIIVIYVLVITLSFVISAIIYFIAHNFRRTEPQAQSRIFKRLFFLFSSTLWTFITCLPYRVLYLITPLFPPCFNPDDSEVRIFCLLTAIFYKIIVVGIVINPLITVVTQRMYRQHLIKYGEDIFEFFKRLLRPICCCGTRESRSILDKNRNVAINTTTSNASSSPKIVKNKKLLQSRNSLVSSNKAEDARLVTSEC